MWHEARKQERLIRGMIVDYRRRAERRKDFYEKIKAEPTQFLQLHGRPCKIHLDPAVAAAGEGPAIMMPWQGDSSNMIDRFDVRAHLDYIPEVKHPDIPPDDLSPEERQCNYERYRILAQNAFLGIGEDKFLQQLAIEEQFGVTVEEKEAQKEKLNEKKGTGVAIGYNYNDPGSQPSSYNGSEVKKKEELKDSDDDSDLEIIDVDLSIDVNKMEAAQAHELNAVGPLFGMAGCDLFSFLTGDADDAEQQKQLLREEKEKAMFSGRKSRRERRAVRDKKLLCRTLSPPSYAAPGSVAGASQPPGRSPSKSPSRSPSPDDNNIQFITEFGPEDDEVKPPPGSKLSYADKVKQNLRKTDLYSDVVRRNRRRSSSSEDASPRPMIGPRRKSLSRSRSRSRLFSRSRSRSRSYRRSRSRSYSSRSRSYSPYKRSRSRSSKPRGYRSRRSISPNNTSAKRKSRSMSYERETKPSVPRYYGRRKEDKSSSELSIDSESSDDAADSTTNASTVGNKSNSNQNQLRLSGSSAKGRPSKETLTLKEKLKRKMQAQLSRQLRADKRAEQERLERENRRQARRDEEMRNLALKLRRKQRDMRHTQRGGRSSDDSDSSRSVRSDRGERELERHEHVERQSPPPPPGTRDYRSRSRSKSKSPLEKRIPVWETNRQSPPSYRPKPKEPERSHYQDRRRFNYEAPYPDRPPYDERSYNQNRYDRYPNKNLEREIPNERYPNKYVERHDNYHRSDYHHERSQPSRRPYGHRGGYRGYGHRSGHSEHYGDGPSWQGSHEEKYSSSENDGKRVKLVDY